MYSDIQELKDEGFGGFHKVDDLMQDNCASIPVVPGVYMILNPTREKNFLNESVGGHFKGKNPTVPTATLERNWVNDTIILYIGNTGRTLRARINELMKFGQGNRVGHWGGRLVWQLGNSSDLLICYQAVTDEEPADMKAGIIARFRSNYGNYPFANNPR